MISQRLLIWLVDWRSLHEYATSKSLVESFVKTDYLCSLGKFLLVFSEGTKLSYQIKEHALVDNVTLVDNVITSSHDANFVVRLI